MIKAILRNHIVRLAEIAESFCSQKEHNSRHWDDKNSGILTCVEITEKQYYMKSGYALLQLICFMKIFCQYFLLQTELSSHYVYRLKVLKNLSDDGIA